MSCYGNGRLVQSSISTPEIVYYTTGYKNSSQTIPTGVNTKVTLEAKEAENPTGFFDLPLNRATIPADGNWVITANLEATITNGGRFEISIQINGTEYAHMSNLHTIANVVMGSCSIAKHLASGDLISMYCQQATGVNATLSGSARNCNLSIVSTALD